jgi:hypothetical protein
LLETGIDQKLGVAGPSLAGDENEGRGNGEEQGDQDFELISASHTKLVQFTGSEGQSFEYSRERRGCKTRQKK